MNAEGREFITPGIDKRQHRRAMLVTQIRCESLGREELMLTRDISTGGMFATAKNPFPSDSTVSVSFRLAAGDPPISCRGKIVYSIQGMGMGITFEDLSEEARQALQKFVDAAE